MASLFGPDDVDEVKQPGSWLGGNPEPDSDTSTKSQKGPHTPMVAWARKAAITLKRQRQTATEEMKRAVNLARGGTPFWQNRDKWKIGTKLNYCVAKGERVSTQRGIVRIEEVIPGDVCPSGEVSATQFNGLRETVVVSTSRGYRVRCTPDHRILTKNGWVEAQFCAGQEVILEPPIFAKEYAIDAGVVFDEDWGRWLGYFMGDGTCHVPGGTIAIACATKDPDIVEDVKRLGDNLLCTMPRGPGKFTRDDCTISPRRESLVSVVTSRRSAVSVLQKLGAADDKRRVVCVPDIIWNSPKPVVREFIRGLFESDGNASKRQRQFCLVAKNRAFLQDIQLLLLGFGVHSWIVKRKGLRGGLPTTGPWVNYALTLNHLAATRFNEEIGFISKRKIAIATTPRQSKYRKPKVYDMSDVVVSVEDAEPICVYDLSVPSSERFSANGIVVHNCMTVPLTWTAILTDAKPSVSYTALDRSKQKRADIATAAWNQAYDQWDWEQKIHDAVLVSRVQKAAYLSLRPHLRGDQVEPRVTVFLGEQVYMNKTATCPDDAEIVFAEYRESYGSLCARFKGLRKKIAIKYDEHTDYDENRSVQSLPTSYTYPQSSQTQVGGSTYATPSANLPPFGASPNPPNSHGGIDGMRVWEFWTRPHKTISIEEVQFLTSGEPATQPKMFKTANPLDEEPLRRIITEGGVIYELPESLVNSMYDLPAIKIISDRQALEVLTHPVKYPLYPHGRLVTIVDEDIEADDRMNPLGYFPFAQIKANSDPGGAQLGPSDVDLIADPYEQLVRLVSLVYDTANLTGNSVWRIPEGATISNDDITNAPGSIQREDMMCLRYGKREAAPELPNYIPNTIKFLVEQIKELSGLSDMTLGKVPPRMQISTETATLHQEASGVRFRDSLANLSRAMRTLGGHFLEFMARFYTSPVMVQIKNDAGVPEPTPMLGAYLTDPFIVEAKAGSRQPSGPSARLNALLNLKNAGVPVSLDTIYQIAEELGTIPSASGAIRQIETLMRDPSQKWKLLGLAQPGQAPKKAGSRRSKKAGNPAA